MGLYLEGSTPNARRVYPSCIRHRQVPSPPPRFVDLPPAHLNTNLCNIMPHEQDCCTGQVDYSLPHTFTTKLPSKHLLYMLHCFNCWVNWKEKSSLWLIAENATLWSVISLVRRRGWWRVPLTVKDKTLFFLSRFGKKPSLVLFPSLMHAYLSALSIIPNLLHHISKVVRTSFARTAPDCCPCRVQVYWLFVRAY